MSLPVSWHFVWQDQGTVVALLPVCSLCNCGKFGLGAGWKEKKVLCLRWGCFCFDWERPADRSSLASLQ